MHPRADVTHHALVPLLLRTGVAVWTQQPRSVNNDISLVHEQTLLDVAAGNEFLRDCGFESVVALGHSGGGTLYAFYSEQAGLPPEQRIAKTPSGRPINLAEASMPEFDGIVFWAPHPGQGQLLLRCIDPSVTDESDPLSIDPDLYAFNPANGFIEPPQSSTYAADFIERYTHAQHERVARIDEVARQYVAEAIAARQAFAQSSDPLDRRRALVPRIITVYRTDADLRTVDLSLDPNDRPYGSVFGRRPDLINHGMVGFGRLCTPDSWLSTWSGLSSNADFVRCAPGVRIPALFVELTGDQAAFPSVSARMRDALGSMDMTNRRVRGTHFGGAINPGEPLGSDLTAEVVAEWLNERFALVPPA
ncbi:alpha/beta hydrolase [Mycobacterium vicinigordonae]|nr:alpha/beta hydrolase [Mycobacterium vicinigordonae]